MRELDFENSIAVTRDIHWTGYHDKEAHLHCNSYLLVDDNDVVLFDPGSIPHFPIVMRKIIDIVQPTDITLIVASHQDPDVCSSLPVLEDLIGTSRTPIAAHINTIRLIRNYGLDSEFFAVDENNFKFILESGRTLDFIWTPFLHSPGAIMTYDSKQKALFSSDIFGAIDKNWTLFAEGDFLSGMEAFHKAYMPSNAALKACMEKIESMDIEIILPQHGSILEGENIRTAIDHLKGLSCGLDLL